MISERAWFLKLFCALAAFAVLLLAQGASASDKKYGGDIEPLFREFRDPEIREREIPGDVFYGRLGLRYFELFEWGRIGEVATTDMEQLFSMWFVTPSGKKFRPDDLISLFRELQFVPPSEGDAIEAADMIFKVKKGDGGGLTVISADNMDRFRPVFDMRRFEDEFRLIAEKEDGVNGDDIRKALIDEGYIDAKGVVQARPDSAGEDFDLDVFMTPGVRKAVFSVVGKYRDAPNAESLRLELNEAVWDEVKKRAMAREPRKKEIVAALYRRGFIGEDRVITPRFYAEKEELYSSLNLSEDEKEAVSGAFSARRGTIPATVLETVHPIRAEKKKDYYEVAFFAYISGAGAEGPEQVVKYTVLVGKGVYEMTEKEVWSAKGRH